MCPSGGGLRIDDMHKSSPAGLLAGPAALRVPLAPTLILLSPALSAAFVLSMPPRLRLEGADGRGAGEVDLLAVGDHRVVFALVVVEDLLSGLRVVAGGADVRPDHRDVDRLSHDTRGSEHDPAHRVLPADLSGPRVERVEALVLRAGVNGG